jgi:hypothetical protein
MQNTYLPLWMTFCTSLSVNIAVHSMQSWTLSDIVRIRSRSRVKTGARWLWNMARHVSSYEGRGKYCLYLPSIAFASHGSAVIFSYLSQASCRQDTDSYKASWGDGTAVPTRTGIAQAQTAHSVYRCTSTVQNAVCLKQTGIDSARRRLMIRIPHVNT